MRIGALVVAVWLVVFGARRADACGYWSMQDKEKGLTIGYLINSASIAKGERRWATQYLDLDAKDGIRVVRDRKVVLDLKAGKLRKYGKVIGTIDTSGALTINRHTYTIELTDPGRQVEVPSWKLVVKRGDDVILTSDLASSLCAGVRRDPPMTDAESREEVRRRVIYYLAWRETGN
jgi:hypothetical protein